MDRLVVVCCGREGDAVIAETRAEWIRIVFPRSDIEIISTPDDLPESPGERICMNPYRSNLKGGEGVA